MNGYEISISKFDDQDGYQNIVDALSNGGNIQFEIIPDDQNLLRYNFTANCYYIDGESLSEKIDSLWSD